MAHKSMFSLRCYSLELPRDWFMFVNIVIVGFDDSELILLVVFCSDSRRYVFGFSCEFWFSHTSSNTPRYISPGAPFQRTQQHPIFSPRRSFPKDPTTTQKLGPAIIC